MENQYKIWRTYFGKRYSILDSNEYIHEQILKRANRKGHYTKKDADILTEFFQEYKRMATSKNIGDLVTLEYLKNEKISVPFINFSLPGTKFEKELEILQDKAAQQAVKKILDGTSSGTTYLYLGDFNIKNTNEEILEKIFGISGEGKFDKEFLELVGKGYENVIKREIEGQPSKSQVYLKMGLKRAGKVDNFGTGSVKLTLTGTPSAKTERLIQLLKFANFSVKSYETNKSIHLGKTNKIKAASGVASYVGGRKANASALFYAKYTDGYEDSSNTSEVKEIYSHYNHMIQIYELSGYGLTYDIGKMIQTDFLLVNRTKAGGSIKVFLVEDLIEKYLKHNERNVSLSTFIK